MTTATGSSGTTISTVAQSTFTMLELSDIADCNAIRPYLIKKGLKDLSPPVNGKATVSFNGKLAATNGTSFIDQIEKIHSDWFILSGHHGILYSSEYDKWPETSSDKEDYNRCFNENEYAGFFNNDYHDGHWDKASRSKPTAGGSQREIYCSTTSHAPALIAPFPQKNPFIPADASLLSAHCAKCKGIILSACNTLVYRSVRMKLVSSFPNAVIFGTLSRIPRGLYVVKSLMAAPSTGKDFWNNPTAFLASKSDMPMKIAKEIVAQGKNYNIDLGMIYNNKIYMDDVGKTEAFSHDFNYPTIY